MLRETSVLDDGWPRLPLPDRLKRMDQHDNVQGEIVANVKPDQNLERKREHDGSATGSFLASRKPATIDSVSEIELTMLSPK